MYAVNIDTLEDKLENYDNLIEKLENQEEKLQEEKNEIKEDLQNQKNYNLLVQIGKLSESQFNQIGSRYEKIKKEILNNYSNIDSSIYSLKKKKQLDIFTGEEYDDKLNNINIDIQDYFQEYSGVVNNFYEKESEKIKDYEELYEEKNENLSEALDNIKDNEDKIKDLLDKYGKLEKKIQKIENLYIGNKKNVQEFMDKVKKSTKKMLEKKIQDKIEKYKDQNSSLDYYDKQIKDYAESMMISYKDAFDKKFDAIFQDFYNQENYDFVETEIKGLKQKYMTGDNIKYELLT